MDSFKKNAYRFRYGCSLIILSVIILTGFSKAEAQNPISIIEADSIVGGTVNNQNIRRILGNVHIESREQNLEMFADSAYQYLGKSEVRAFGNVQINTEEEQIFADTLIYLTQLDFSQLRGRVIIKADSATLFSQALDYRFSTKVAHFLEKVRLEDPEGVLTANTGYYYREPDSAVFRGDVQLSDSLQYVEGDSLFINRRENTYRLYGDLFVNDMENNLMLKGDSLKADSVGHRFLQGNAWLKRFPPPETDSTTASPDSATADSASADLGRSEIPPPTADTAATDTTSMMLRRSIATSPPDTARTDSAGAQESASADTTHIRAKIIHSIQKTTETDTQRVINAYENVRIWSPKFAAIADTARYVDSTETFVLRSNPIAWHKQIQLTGPYIRVKLQNNEIDQLISYPRPFVVQEDTSIDRLNQITGDTLWVNFTNGEISLIRVQPNSHLLRYMANENGESDGLIDITAPSTVMRFRNGALDTLIMRGTTDGFYLPASEESAERQLDGFVWSPDRRPQKPTEPMKRRLPPIPKEPPFELPPRYVQTLQKE